MIECLLWSVGFVEGLGVVETDCGLVEGYQNNDNGPPCPSLPINFFL